MQVLGYLVFIVYKDGSLLIVLETFVLIYAQALYVQKCDSLFDKFYLFCLTALKVEKFVTYKP